MSFRKFAVALSATTFLGTFGISSAFAGTPHCGVFTDDTGAIAITSEQAQYSNSQLSNEGRFSAVGPQFGCWLDIGTSPQIRGTMMYSYVVTDPKGQTKEFGPYGIQAGGFGSGRIAAYTANGFWRMEFFLVSRENGAKSSIGTITVKLNP